MKPKQIAKEILAASESYPPKVVLQSIIKLELAKAISRATDFNSSDVSMAVGDALKKVPKFVDELKKAIDRRTK